MNRFCRKLADVVEDQGHTTHKVGLVNTVNKINIGD